MNSFPQHAFSNSKTCWNYWKNFGKSSWISLDLSEGLSCSRKSKTFISFVWSQLYDSLIKIFICSYRVLEIFLSSLELSSFTSHISSYAKCSSFIFKFSLEKSTALIEPIINEKKAIPTNSTNILNTYSYHVYPNTSP